MKHSPQSIHFIGIGGIGISAIARMMLAKGAAVSGSDREASKVTDELAKLGAQIHIGQKAENIAADCSLVVYTVAIPTDNPELVAAHERDIETVSYPEMLGRVSREKFTVAVSGTHGKTTTTAMLAHILLTTGKDPTVIVGSLMQNPADKNVESNFIAGKSDLLIVEADEYRKSFHNLEPKILIINNIDADHLDFYKDLADIQDSFAELAGKLPSNGVLICNPHDAHVKPVVEAIKKQKSGIESVKIIDSTTIKLEKTLLVPGEHNRQNARSAIAAALELGVPQDEAEKALKNFTGVWRRFEFKGKTKTGALVYDDYAHNPQKVRAVLAAAREKFPNTTITAVFQPHLFSRTKTLFQEFATSFADADNVILAPIFPAREAFDPTISSDMLAEAIRTQSAFMNTSKKTITSLPSFEAIAERLETISEKISVGGQEHVIFLIGASDIYKIADKLVV